MSPSAAPVRRSGNTARHSARCCGAAMTRERLTADTIALARQYGRYGYRKIAGLLESRRAGFPSTTSGSSTDLATRGAEGAPQTTKRGRLWLADGSCIRLRPEHRNHVWSYDFVEDRTLASARDRLAESRLLCECDVIFEVVRTRSVHEGGYGHNRVRSAA